ncbi:MAG: cation-translocating P-type ATPase [Haloarculaceae archaeon]
MSCTLCDLDLPAEPATDPEVDGEYCCRGCLEVARSLGDVEAVEREAPADLLEGGADEAEGEVAYLSVEGMHCATCELFLESTATGHEGVEAATASYATETMKVVYDPDRVAGEQLPELVSGTGYEARTRALEREEESDPRVARLLVGGFFAMMAMGSYALFIYPQHFGFDPVVDFGAFGRGYLLGQVWLFASVVLFYTGYPLLRGAYVSLRAGQPNMDLLVALAATAAYLYSTAVAVGGGLDVYFDVTIAVVMVVTAGTHYEQRVKGRAVGLLADLTADRVETARTPGGETLDIEDVTPGTQLLVRPGERVPLDGTVTEGVAAVDEALVTGESLPVTKRPGDEVVGGAVVTDAPLVVEVGEGATSTRDRVVGLMWEIQSARPGVQQLADKLATVFVPLVSLLALAVAAGTLVLGGSVTDAVLVGLTVLVVSCPCALGLATPLAVAAGTRRAAEEGVVVASETVFETLPDVETVAVDKTGTLTSGDMTVVDAVGESAVLARAAALERYSSHPVADAVVSAAGAEADGDASPLTADGADSPGGPGGPSEATSADGGVSVPAADDADIEVVAKGVAGPVEGAETVVGHPDLFEERGWAVPERYRERAAAAREDGAVPVLVGWDGRCRGVLVVGDRPRADWDAVVEALGDDRRVVVLTGDDSAAAARFADHEAVNEVFSGVPPDGKVAAVQRLREDGRVAMVGDGANDAPALAAADVGIALARGTELATDAADAVVTDGRLGAVPTLFAVAGRTRRRVRGNLAWAFGYNAVAVPLAATGMLNPLFAALAMGTSSLLVVLNSSRTLVPDD